MIISLIAAIDKNNTIGSAGKMPWSLPADLAYFKETTLGHTVVMGRRTYESIGRALPQRKNIILTSDKNFHRTGCIVMHAMEEVMTAFADTEEEVFIIGGGEVYRQFLPFARRLYLTILNHQFPGDTYFPEFDPKEWELRSVRKGIRDEENPYEYAFHIYENFDS